MDLPRFPTAGREAVALRPRWLERAAIPALAALFALGTYGALRLLFHAPPPRPLAGHCPAFALPPAGSAQAVPEDWQRLMAVQELGEREPRRALVDLQQDQARFEKSPLEGDRDALGIHLQICLRGVPAVRPAAEEFLGRSPGGLLAEQLRRELGPR